MPIRKNALPTLAILLMAFGGSLIVPHWAVAQQSSGAVAQQSSAVTLPPALIQSWKDHLKNYPAAQAEYQREQTEGRKTAQLVSVSEEKNMDDLVKFYPFLREDIQSTKDVEKTIIENVKKNPPPSGPALQIAQDTATHMYATEVPVKELGMKLLFVAKTGKLWCGDHGCNMMVYLDTGAGYKEATGFITTGMYLSTVGRQVFLFAGPPTDQAVVEWILKDNKFVKNTPPPAEPQSPAFASWKQKLKEEGKWPPQ